MSAELEQVTLAVAAINKVEMGLTVLRERFGGVIYEVATTEGLEAAKAARSEIREPRYEVEKIRKAAKAPILSLGKKLDSEAARITTELEKIENPIHLQIKAEEDRKEAERQRKIDLEIARVKALQERVEELRGCQTLTPSSGSELIQGHLDDLDRIPVDSTFEELEDQAASVKEAGLKRLMVLWTAARTYEAEQQKLAEDHAEFARLKSEEDERQRVAREAQAKTDAEARAKRDADTAAQAAIDKANRERNEAALQEIQAIHHQLFIADSGRAPYCKGGDLASIDFAIDGTEKWELDEERFAVLYAAAVKAKETTLAALRQKRVDFIARQENAAEALRQAEVAAKNTADREQLEREQEAARKAAEPKPEPPKPAPARIVERPSAAQLIALVSSHYSVTSAMAEKWLRNIKWEREAA